MTSSKHAPSGHTPTTLPRDDLKTNPGIGGSKGATAGNADPRDLEDGETTFEGDVENDSTPQGGIDPQQRGRSNK